MNQDPRTRVDFLTAASTRPETPHPSHPTPTPSSTHQGIKEICRTLAAHGAGDASLELAFELVLHEVVEQAREVTRASGAAIAFLREGEMVCRATTGESAPELGARVDIRSGITGACFNTGRIQNWRDAEDDGGNTELGEGVRAILLAPIGTPGEVCGILRLWSDKRDGFREEEIAALEPALNQAHDSWKLIQDHSWISFRADGDCESETPRGSSDTASGGLEAEPGFVPRGEETDRGKLRQLSSTVLFFLVIGLAILLGVVIGWRRGREQRDAASTSNAIRSTPIAVAKDSPMDGERGASSAGTSNTASTASPELPAGGTTLRENVPAGHLVISENGKVLYRSDAQTVASGIATSTVEKTTPIVYQVVPKYPPEAIAHGVEGPVVLDVKLRGDGTVEDVSVVSGEPLLIASAVEAIRQWRFRPSSGNGGAMESQTRITVRFVLPADAKTQP